ncbi:helix-turn-helix transcriptional regulator [Variovorax paradoxus]|nr:AraC family transcriptional regulator [Variovorax paradoxus]MBT2300174.1 helix-turn-helix transcriptional regulator [Variovorax paradoxus]
MRTIAGIVVVQPGALLRIAPHVWHSVHARTAPWREDALYCSFAVARCVNPSDDIVRTAREEDDAAVSIFTDPTSAREFIECHRLLYEAARSGNEEIGAAGRSLLRQRLAQWIPPQAAAARTQTRDYATTIDSGDDRVNHLYELIAKGFRQRLTLDALAEAVGWHPVHLQRRFKSALGFTPHELLVGHRVEYARDLIAGGARVTYAAHAAGFTDQSHLHKTFLSTYAVLPGEYRRLSVHDALQPPSARNGIAG